MKRAFLVVALRYPRWTVAVSVVLTIVAGLQFPSIRIDTDPENMLPEDEPVRVFHDRLKETFDIADMLVVGIVDEDGVFTPETLDRVARLTEHILEIDGVIAADVLAPTEVDDVQPAEGGGISVSTLMEDPPQTVEEARDLHRRIQENPILRGKLASDDGEALALFVPLESKDVAERVGDDILAYIEELGGDEEYHLAGLPIAEDSFGSEMFMQMGVAAPLAFFVIFLLLLFFFRRPAVVAGPMIVAMMSVIWTMGLLIGLGFTVHIMSSMIPVFLIPIAVLDTVHLLSEIAGLRRKGMPLEKAIRISMHELFPPMLFTTVTTIVGFTSLLLTPIPPVQVFGVFVAVGVLVAWLLTMTFIPAYTMLLPAGAFEFAKSTAAVDFGLRRFYGHALRMRVPIVVGLVVVLAASAWGISKIEVNDNPVFWFKSSHPLRRADEVMNQHLAGTYLAYLSLESESEEEGAFLDPEWMNYVERVQEEIASKEFVGGTTSIADVVKKVRWELLDRAEGSQRLPDSREANAQFLFLYEMSGGEPDDLFKLMTPGQDKVNIWVQMTRGENKRVANVVHGLERWIEDNPPPAGMKSGWGGLSYVNVIWQEKMVAGMGKALSGSFIVVLVMMSLLFRSLWLGLISMIPLTATIMVTYGFVGWIGKPYDMPIAVLSSLALGLSIDFAIHFIQRTREFFRRARGDFAAAMDAVFGVPAEALARNVAVISLGFVPMFFSNLMPYVTVGAYFFAIMIISGLATFVVLPAVLSFLPAKRIASLDDARPAEPVAREELGLS